MVVACTHISLRNNFMRRTFATVLVLLLAIRVFEVQSVWADLSPSMKSFHDSVQQIERGSKILVAYADPGNGDDGRDLWLAHAACLAIIERSALVTTAFTVLGKQVLHVRTDYRERVDTEDGAPPSIKQLLQAAERTDGAAGVYWRHWTRDFDFLYVLFTDPDFKNPDPTRLTLIYVGPKFVLFKSQEPHLDKPGRAPGLIARIHIRRNSKPSKLGRSLSPDADVGRP
jgi:hypothetical protein